MKKIFFLLIPILFGISCEDPVFNNPLDPANELLAPTKLEIVSTSADTSITLQWEDPNNYGKAKTDNLNF